MKTHILGSIAAGTIVFMSGYVPVTNMTTHIAYGGSLVIGALLPDICAPNSWIGRRFTMTSTLIQSIFGHRTFTHSALFLLFLYYFLENFASSPLFVVIQYGLTIGVLSHILLDMVTPRGVMLFYPLKKYFRFPITIKTGSIIGETIVSLLFLSWIIYFHLIIM